MQLRTLGRRAALLGGLGLAAGTLALTTGAGSALAAPTSPHHPATTNNEQFDILLASGGVNVLHATGPISGTGTDHETGANLGVFTLPLGTATVLHAGLGAPTVDLATCTVTYSVHSAPWRILSDTGAFRGDTGSGKFTAVALYSFGLGRGGQCSIPWGAYGNGGEGMGNPEQGNPVFWSVEVQGIGHVTKPVPVVVCITPTGHNYGAPGQYPTGQPVADSYTTVQPYGPLPRGGDCPAPCKHEPTPVITPTGHPTDYPTGQPTGRPTGPVIQSTTAPPVS